MLIGIIFVYLFLQNAVNYHVKTRTKLSKKRQQVIQKLDNCFKSESATKMLQKICDDYIQNTKHRVTANITC